MNSKNELVVKSNRLVEASYRLSLVEQRVVLLAIVEARRTQKGLTADDFVTIAALNYAAMYDVPLNKAYEQIKEAALTLYERGFVLYDTHPESGMPRVIKARWVSAISYIDGAGAIQLRFSAEVVPYITRLEAEFTRYKLEKVAHMSSAYAIRLYELLMQWGSIGRREIELEWLKKTLMVDKDYTRLDNFKKRVLDVAMAQINEHSDLTASYTQRKTGRIVTHLIFTFSFKTDPKQETKQEIGVAQPPKPPRIERDENSPFLHAKTPIPPKTQIDYLKARTKEEIELCIERANEYGIQQEKAGKPVRYGALYRKAIAEGWHEEKARQKAEQAEIAAKKAAALKQAAAEKQAKAEQAERSQTERELSAAWFAALPDAEKEAMGSAYVAESNAVDAGLFKRKGYKYAGFQFFIKRKWQESESR